MALNDTLYNTTGIIGQILNSGTQTITGQLILTLVLILIILMAVCMMFQIPLEIISIILLPFCIAVVAYEGTFMVPITLILIYVSAIIAKNWLFK